MREVAKTGDSWKVLMTGIKGLASGIGDALKDPVSQLYILYNVASSNSSLLNGFLGRNGSVKKLGELPIAVSIILTKSFKLNK